jgi:hypothetical protein
MKTDFCNSDEEFPALDGDFFKQQQLKEEERIKREQQDEIMARKMQEDHSFPVTMASSSSSSRPSCNFPTAFDRISGIRHPSNNSSQKLSQNQQHSASIGRKLPWPSSNFDFNPASAKSERSSTPSDFSSNELAGSATSPKPFKNESSISYPQIKAESRSQKPMPGAFIDIDGLSATDDSDIEIIDATDFQDNGRYSQPSKPTSQTYGNPFKKRPNFSPGSQVAGGTALRRGEQSPTNDALQMAMFGNAPVPTWMNGTMQSRASPNSIGNVYNARSAGFGNNAGSSMQGAGRNPFTSAGSFNGTGSMAGAYPDTIETPGHGLDYTMNNVPLYNNQLSRLYGGGYQRYDQMPGRFDGGLMSDAMADQYDYIVNDPRKTNDEIKALLENIRPDVDLPREDREGTPVGLKYPLYEHQKIALSWLKGMEESKHKGGILADDMGLGKTISSLALILARPSDNRACKTTLIVGPVALVRQWEREIQNKIKNQYSLSTHMVHGQHRRLPWDQLQKFDVVLTTYGTLAAEFKRYDKFTAEHQADGHHLDHDIDPNPLKKQFPLLGPKSLFYRVILDEAQCIKNKSTVSARATWHLKSETRLCLTGTPMMNNIGELYPLIHFLQIRPYNDYTQFRHVSTIPTKLLEVILTM